MTKEKAVQKDFLGLRTKRKDLGLTLQDIFASTRVSVVNLEAIENGDFGDLPVPIYTKNFIKTYARALDIDSKPILDSYEAYLNSLQITETQLQETLPVREPFIVRISRYKTYIWTAVIILVIAVVAFVISQQYQPAREVAGKPPGNITTPPPAQVNTPVEPPVSTTEQTTTAVSPAVPEVKKQPPTQVLVKQLGEQVAAKPKTVLVQSAPVNEQINATVPPVTPEAKKQPSAQVLVKQPGQQNAAVPKPVLTQSTPKIEKTAPAPINEEAGLLVIRSTEQTWLRIKIDQNESFQVLLKPGEKIERQGAVFDLDIGNAGGITMQFKGKSFENLGKSGQVIHLRLPE